MRCPVNSRSRSSGVPTIFPGGWTLGDYNVVAFPGLDPFGNAFTFHMQVFVPLGYSPSTPCKAVMCGHGSTERSGTNTGPTSNNNANNTFQITNASTFAGQWLNANKATCDHIVLFPQTQLIDLNNAFTQGWCTAQQRDQYIENVYYTAWQYAITQFNISKRKIYGFSSGAFAMYNLMTRQPTYWDYVWSVEGDVNAGNYPYNASLTQSQQRQLLSTTMAGSSTILRIDQNGDDTTVFPAGAREIASVMAAGAFTTPFTTAPTYPYTSSSTSILANGASYHEYASGGHDPGNALTTGNIATLMAV